MTFPLLKLSEFTTWHSHYGKNLPTTQTWLPLHFSHLYFNLSGVSSPLLELTWLIRFNSVLSHNGLLWLFPLGTIYNLIATVFAKPCKVSNMSPVRKSWKTFWVLWWGTLHTTSHWQLFAIRVAPVLVIPWISLSVDFSLWSEERIYVFSMSWHFEVIEQLGKTQMNLENKGLFKEARMKVIFLCCFCNIFNNSGVKTKTWEQITDNNVSLSAWAAAYMYNVVLCIFACTTSCVFSSQVSVALVTIIQSLYHFYMVLCDVVMFALVYFVSGFIGVSLWSSVRKIKICSLFFYIIKLGIDGNLIPYLTSSVTCTTYRVSFLLLFFLFY